jgi:hypothetical protein
MNIEILKYLEENPEAYPNDVEDRHPIVGIPLIEIEALETKYNGGNSFPKALRELLYLAGNYCYVLDNGGFDSQDELQSSQREWMDEYNTSISRPFFIVDLVSDMENFAFIYTDVQIDDPMLYHFMVQTGEIYELQTLKTRIDGRIDMMKKGLNPF